MGSCFWRLVSGKKLGVQFRRQVLIGESIVDFAVRSARLVVEIDGPYHQRRALTDARRDRKLRSLGWRVLRLSEEAVFRRPEEVSRAVKDALLK